MIQGYGDGGFTVSEVRYEGGILVFPERVESWPPTAAEALTVADFTSVIASAANVSILLLGCGSAMALIPAAPRAALAEVGIAVEAMDTGAACRTYNVLLSEDRRVAAALIPV